MEFYPHTTLKLAFRAPFYMQTTRGFGHLSKHDADELWSLLSAYRTRLASIDHSKNYKLLEPEEYDLKLLKQSEVGDSDVDQAILDEKAQFACEAALFAADKTVLRRAIYNLQKALGKIAHKEECLRAIFVKLELAIGGPMVVQGPGNRQIPAHDAMMPSERTNDPIAKDVLEFLREYQNRLLGNESEPLVRELTFTERMRTTAQISERNPTKSGQMLKFTRPLRPFMADVFERLPVLARRNPSPSAIDDFLGLIKGAPENYLEAGEFCTWNGKHPGQ